jgi:hypothetical protein
MSFGKCKRERERVELRKRREHLQLRAHIPRQILAQKSRREVQQHIEAIQYKFWAVRTAVAWHKIEKEDCTIFWVRLAQKSRQHTITNFWKIISASRHAF